GQRPPRRVDLTDVEPGADAPRDRDNPEGARSSGDAVDRGPKRHQLPRRGMAARWPVVRAVLLSQSARQAFGRRDRHQRHGARCSGRVRGYGLGTARLRTEQALANTPPGSGATRSYRRIVERSTTGATRFGLLVHGLPGIL